MKNEELEKRLEARGWRLMGEGSRNYESEHCDLFYKGDSNG